MNEVVCTLFDKDSERRLGALINSLYANGYRGSMWAGYAEQLPFWAKAAAAQDGYHQFLAAENFCVNFTSVNPQGSLMSQQPAFMLKVISSYAADSDAVFFMTPDIVIDVAWSFFADWMRLGVSVCSVERWDVPSTDPLRLSWKRAYEEAGLQKLRDLNIYASASALGVSRANVSFLSTWIEMQAILQAAGDFPRPVCTEDGLNASLEITNEPISLMGPDAMAFKDGYRVMFKTTSAAHGESAGESFRSLNAARAFLRHSVHPIKVSKPSEDMIRLTDHFYGLVTGRIRPGFRE